MYVIKMENDKTLFATIESTIFEGESGADVITFLTPKNYNDINLADCTMLCRYILPDGIGYSDVLNLYPVPYNDDLYQYKLPVGSKLTSKQGKVELWLTAIDYADKTILKTDTISIQIMASKNIVDYLSNEDLNQLDALAAKIEEIESSQVDSLIYDPDDKILQLSADGEPVGDAVSTEEIADDGKVILFGSEEGSV